MELHIKEKLTNRCGTSLSSVHENEFLQIKKKHRVLTLADLHRHYVCEYIINNNRVATNVFMDDSRPGIWTRMQ